MRCNEPPTASEMEEMTREDERPEYQCADCGATCVRGSQEAMSWWVCPDKRLRCPLCMLKRDMKAYPLQEKKEGARA